MLYPPARIAECPQLAQQHRRRNPIRRGGLYSLIYVLLVGVELAEGRASRARRTWPDGERSGLPQINSTLTPAKPTAELPAVGAQARRKDCKKLAEREGFEPSVPVTQYARLAIWCLRPLGHLSVAQFAGSQRRAAS